MRCHGIQILVTSVLTTCSAYILLDGYTGIKPHYPLDAPSFHPLRVPPPPLPPPLPPPPYLYREPPRIAPWSPPVLPPPPIYQVKGVFPPFIERIVQRIQTIWSVYNPPELLTRPPPYSYPSTTKNPKRKPSSISNPTTTTTKPTTATTPEDLAEDRIPTALPGTESPNNTPDADTDTTTTSTPSPVEQGLSGVSTLAVYEVTPSSRPEVEDMAPAPQEPPESGTPVPNEEDGITPTPEEILDGGTPPLLDQLDDDTEDTLFITPERASLFSHKDAYLRYLQTGKVPPYLESDRFNEMDEIFN